MPVLMKKTIAYAVACGLSTVLWCMALHSCGGVPGAPNPPGHSQIGTSEILTPTPSTFQFPKSQHKCFVPKWDSSKLISILIKRPYSQNKWVYSHTKLNWGNMIYGYARVSREDQDLRRQITQLEAVGCDEIITEKMSGANTKRPEYMRLLSLLQPGDIVIVVKLDRFGRSMSHLVQTLTDFSKRGIGFKSLGDSIDITTANGRLMLGILASFAEFERELIRERTIDGLAQARRNGKKLGRPELDQSSQQSIFDGYYSAGKTIDEIQGLMNIKRWKAYQFKTNSQNENVNKQC
jgi:DNA invertase Pin-like site-specific DNA recombinase